jgi:DNA-directed RNA polymerase specialized sigma subunit
LPRSVRRFQKQRDAVIDEFSVVGKAPSDAHIPEALGVSTTRYVTLSRMITAAEPISIHEAAIADELAG